MNGIRQHPCCSPVGGLVGFDSQGHSLQYPSICIVLAAPCTTCLTRTHDWGQVILYVRIKTLTYSIYDIRNFPKNNAEFSRCVLQSFCMGDLFRCVCVLGVRTVELDHFRASQPILPCQLRIYD